jgi:hypothetical protein
LTAEKALSPGQDSAKDAKSLSGGASADSEKLIT